MASVLEPNLGGESGARKLKNHHHLQFGLNKFFLTLVLNTLVGIKLNIKFWVKLNDFARKLTKISCFSFRFLLSKIPSQNRIKSPDTIVYPNRSTNWKVVHLCTSEPVSNEFPIWIRRQPKDRWSWNLQSIRNGSHYCKRRAGGESLNSKRRKFRRTKHDNKCIIIPTFRLPAIKSIQVNGLQCVKITC